MSTILYGWSMRYDETDTDPVFFKELPPKPDDDTEFIFDKAVFIIGKEGAEPRVLTGEDLDEVRKAFEFIKEIGQRPDNTITTKAHRIEQMVKWANHGLASLPTP